MAALSVVDEVVPLVVDEVVPVLVGGGLGLVVVGAGVGGDDGAAGSVGRRSQPVASAAAAAIDTQTTARCSHCGLFVCTAGSPESSAQAPAAPGQGPCRVRAASAGQQPRRPAAVAGIGERRF